MTKTKRTEWLVAIGKLERFYRAVVLGKKPSGVFNCPLCDIDGFNNCQTCLWKIFDEKHCQEYAGCKFDGKNAADLRRNGDIPWAKNSLKRLARWRARLEKE